MKLGPDFLLGAAGQRIIVKSRHARLADADGPAHQFKFLGAFDGAGDFGERLALDDGDTALLQRCRTRRVQLVDRQSHIAGAHIAAVAFF